MTEIRVTITNGDGVVEVDPLIEAMIRVLIAGQLEIGMKREGTVELHYNAVTGKVAGKLTGRMGIGKVVP